MPKFKVAVFESLSQVFVIEAQNSAEAIEKLSDAWDKSLISLDNPDSSEADFALIGSANDDDFAVL